MPPVGAIEVISNQIYSLETTLSVCNDTQPFGRYHVLPSCHEITNRTALVIRVKLYFLPFSKATDVAHVNTNEYEFFCYFQSQEVQMGM